MLDRKFIVENAELVRQNCRARGLTVDLDRFLATEAERRARLPVLENLRRQANELAAKIGSEKDPVAREARKEEARHVREQAAAQEKQLAELDEQVHEMQRLIPNMAHPAAPRGASDQDNLEIRRGKTPVPQFDFQPRDHVQLGEALDIIDLEAGSRVTGHGFYFLKSGAVLLELALQQYAVTELIKAGYTPVITPDLAQTEILDGVGYIPRGPETQIYNLADRNLSLIATAEITLGGSLAGQTLDADQLPIRLCGISHCFRTEAGAHGRATRGQYRVHQFTKIEMFAFTLPEQSDALHEELLNLECQLFDGLGIPYRVVDTATGDLGGPAYRKFDLEAWMPGRGPAGEYGEVTSTSNCTDYQARRLNIRSKKKGEKGTQLVHTLNGTAIAVSRALIAILENYQQADGSVRIPDALQKWVGTDRLVAPGKA